MHFFSAFFLGLLASCYLFFISVKAVSNRSGRNQEDRTRSSQSVEPFGKCEYNDGKSSCPDFPEDELLATVTDSPPGGNSQRDEREAQEKSENPMDLLRQDIVSDGFYYPYSNRDLKVGWSGPHAEALAYSRKPFDDLATYAVVDDSSRSHDGYIQVPCGCQGPHCGTYIYVDELKTKGHLRVQQMCVVKKEGGESETMRGRIEKRTHCHPFNDCYGELAKSSAVARCPSASDRKVLKVGMTTAEKNGLLFYHNLLRALRAEGSDVGSIVTDKRQVANMMEMEWDSKLADQAQRLVNICDFNYDCSYCSGRAFVQPVGQIFVQLTTKDRDYIKYLALIFLRISRLSKSDDISFKGNNVSGLHGQLLWAETSRVGCGLVQSQVGDQVEHLLACNYFPSGNRVGSPVLKEGPPCSRCPVGYQCSRFSKVLCSRYFHISVERLQPEESEQFFALTPEEKKIRARIVNLVLHEAKRPRHV